MIMYDKSAFGFNLLFRLHGSAAYRAVVPGLLGVACLLLFRYLRNSGGYGIGQPWDYYTRGDDDLQHPYAVGVLVGATTFTLVFRCTQGYNRYWEACGAIHHMMSKWLDATIHTGCYHMQCAHYDSIKPPSFSDYPELNAYYLTRDRERVRDPKDDGDDASDSGVEDHVEGVHDDDEAETACEANATADDDSENTAGKDDHRPIRRRTTSGTATSSGGHSVEIHSNCSGIIGLSERSERSERRIFNGASNTVLERAVLKSISAVQIKDPETISARINRIKRKHSAEPPTSPCRPAKARLRYPTPLTGTPRLDGNWSQLFNDCKATFHSERGTDTTSPSFLNNLPNFASTKGGRTPPLFLQELAHLSSLMNAVALSTLRNDMEGSVSPLDVYKPGAPWPHVDPDKVESYYLNGTFISRLWRKIMFFFGFMRSPEERTRYNAARPLHVLGGVSDAEIAFLQMARGPSAKTQLCWYWLSEFIIREHLNGSTGKVGPPIVSRIFQFLSDGMIHYNHGRKIMFIPFPFPHAQLSVMFVFVIIPAVAFLMDQYSEDIVAGCVLCFFSIACLSGIHEVARELENPFRNVPNELPLVTLQAQFNEALTVMFAGYHPDHFWDPTVHRPHTSGTPRRTTSQPRWQYSRDGTEQASAEAARASPLHGNTTPLPSATPGAMDNASPTALDEAIPALATPSAAAASSRSVPVPVTIIEEEPAVVPPAPTHAPTAAEETATNTTDLEIRQNDNHHVGEVAQIKEMLESYSREIERLRGMLEAVTGEM